ncbi:MAG TPA: ferritin-like domain-containing protein [Kofleriaceae bacterium]|nr:ferritin-like domain-containing protein [Kofleriaceae bacterium]
MRDLRRTLASIVLFAPLAGCVGGPGCPTPHRTDDTLAIDESDSVLAPLLADCEQAQSCEPLCSELFMRVYGTSRVRFDTCELVARPDDTLAAHVVTETLCVGGRRPGNYRPGVPPATCNAVAAYLARQADLEAASVRAFADLYADLVELGAPAAMRRAAIRAAADEVRHAAMSMRLAKRFGATVSPRQIRAAPRRDLRALVLDNAVEGCVRETYGAAVAGYQARTARDPIVRRAMYRIARDEAKHALLSWQLHRWAAPRLGDRDAVLAAASTARAELSAEANIAQPELHGVLGVPAPAAATAMLAELDARVWSPLAWRS